MLRGKVEQEFNRASGVIAMSIPMNAAMRRSGVGCNAEIGRRMQRRGNQTWRTRLGQYVLRQPVTRSLMMW